MTEDNAWRDPDHLPLDDLTDAMAVFSADGQMDDVTGGDASAEEEFGSGAHADEVSDEGQNRPSPEPRSGPV